MTYWQRPTRWPFLPAKVQPDLENGDRQRRERVAKVLDRRYPRVAAKIRAGTRSSNRTEDLIDPGLLLDLLEQEG